MQSLLNATKYKFIEDRSDQVRFSSRSLTRLIPGLTPELITEKEQGIAYAQVG
jgi:hypothetical protein